MDIGHKLQVLRTNAGLSAESLSEVIGISKSYVHKLEKGKSDPSVPILQRWVNATKPAQTSSEGSLEEREKMERWVTISLSFLFDGGLHEVDDPIEAIDEELVIDAVPQVLTRLLPTHFLHKVYKFFKMD